MKIALTCFAYLLLAAPAIAQWTERKESTGVVIISPQQPSASERRLQKIHRDLKKSAQQLEQQARQARADAAERRRRYCEWHGDTFNSRSYYPPPECR